MKVLLDTHIILWTLADDPKLPVKAKEMSFYSCEIRTPSLLRFGRFF